MTSSLPLELTAWQKMLIRDSFASLGEYAESVAVLCYGRLFEVAPQVRRLFKIEIHEQARKLMGMLTTVIDALDHFGELRHELEELGRRHTGYGIQAADYELLCTALIWAFAQALGAEFDRETRAAWQNLLAAVSKIMLEGAGIRAS